MNRRRRNFRQLRGTWSAHRELSIALGVLAAESVAPIASVEASNVLREPVFDRREIRWRESLERLDLRVATDLRLEHGVVCPWNLDQGVVPVASSLERVVPRP